MEQDRIDKGMKKKGYNYKLIPVGKHEGLDPLYAKTPGMVRGIREAPPVKGMKFRVELI